MLKATWPLTAFSFHVGVPWECKGRKQVGGKKDETIKALEKSLISQATELGIKCIPHGDWLKRESRFCEAFIFQVNCGWFVLFCRGWLNWTRAQWCHYVQSRAMQELLIWCLTALPNSPSRAWWRLYIKNCDRNRLITKFISWQFPHLSLTRAWSKAPLFAFPVRS